MNSDAQVEQQKGTAIALLAYFLWGATPVYLKWLAEVGPREMVVHRIFWTFITCALFLLLMGRWRDIRAQLGQWRTWGWLVLSSLLIVINWLIYTAAVLQDQVLETSLGYFVSPLMSVGLGVLIFQERLSRLAKIAIFIACIGVVNQIWVIGRLPWFAIGVATTFAIYSLVRKQIKISAINSLMAEMFCALPIAMAYWLFLLSQQTQQFARHGLELDVLLMLLGTVTALPLILFGMAARHLPLSTLGFLQYIGPSMNFIFAVFLFHEPLGLGQLTTFVLIWTGLAFFSWDLLRQRWRNTNSRLR